MATPTRSHLVQLSIRNIVLIDSLSIDWDRGLNVLTGETGAGKSILLDALGLVIGGRSEARFVRHGVDHATVCAEFEISGQHPVYRVLKTHDLDMEEGRVNLRRRLSADARSRAYVNDQPVNLTTLRAVGDALVEIHGQHDTHGLMDAKTHRTVLDGYAGVCPLLDSSGHTWREWRTAQKALDDAEAAITAARREEDYLRHMAEELSIMAPVHGEEELLSLERTELMQSEKLAEALRSADDALTNDNGAVAGLRMAEKALNRLADKAGPRMLPIRAQAEKAAIELDELVIMLQSVGHDLNTDPSRLEDVEERLFALKAAARKHRVDVSDLPKLAESFTSRLRALETGEAQLAALRTRSSEAKVAYIAAITQLSAARRAAADELDQAIVAELAPLKMDRAKFETRFGTLPESQWGPTGMDSIEFCIAANSGTPVGPLARVASGGELSRVMLALKVVLASGGALGTIVFDEVDAGIGGATAAAVGDRLSKLSREGSQVLVVTHSPQVAACGRQHWKLSKVQHEKTLTTQVVGLNQQERQDEIARMLSGAEITDAARAAAFDLLAS